MNRATILKKGQPIKYDGLPGWIYRPNPDKDVAWLWLKNWPDDVAPEKVSWSQEWGRCVLDLVPDTKYAAELGIEDLLALPEHPLEARDDVWCPFCNAHYAHRFEVRTAKTKCQVCQGEGERALKAMALVDAWIDEIRSAKDLQRAQALADRLGSGYYRLEIRRFIRHQNDPEKQPQAETL